MIVLSLRDARWCALDVIARIVSKSRRLGSGKAAFIEVIEMSGQGGGASRRPGGPRPGKGPAPRIGPFGLKKVPGTPDGFDLVHPRCVEDTELDYAEGIELWRAGDPEEARDALRFALQGCHDNLWVHAALGQIALREFKDANLARGHFGYAVELVRKSLPPGFAGRLPRDRLANRPYYDALAGLIECLRALGNGIEADRLVALGDRPGGKSQGSRGPSPPPGRRPQGDGPG